MTIDAAQNQPGTDAALELSPIELDRVIPRVIGAGTGEAVTVAEMRDALARMGFDVSIRKRA